MNLLFFGDIFGKPGREGLKRALPALLEKYKPELVVVNAENAAHGKGLTPKIAQELFEMGAHVLTLGNHSFDKKDVLPIMNDPRLLRPANYPSRVPGKGSGIYTGKSGKKIAVLQLMGRVYMPLTDCPFTIGTHEVSRLRQETPIILVDMHAEITAEKSAMGWHLDGLVTMVVGTHTHVQTADERILPGGTAYLTDVGCCGPYNSVIGGEIKSSVERFLTGLHQRLQVGTGDARVCGCVVSVNEETGKALSIERIMEIVPLPTNLGEEK